MAAFGAFPALAVAFTLAATDAPPTLQALRPAQMQVAIQEMAESIPFQRKTFSIKKIFEALQAKGANEDARPLLPSEFLALPEDQRAQALHPDTTCLLVLLLARAAAKANPVEAASTEWMVPVLIWAEPVGNPSSFGLRGTAFGVRGGNQMKLASGAGKTVGPNWPLLEFRRNLPGPDPRVGLDGGSRMVEPDRAARNFSMQHSGGVFKFAPELYFASDEGGRKELENWVLARILIARAEGTWDSPAIRSSFLKFAAPRVPAWDTFLAERLTRASAALEGARPAK